MEIQIKLNAGSGRLLDKSPFLLADNDTPTLVFRSDISLTDCIIEMKNGDEKEKLHIRGLSSVQIPEKLCKQELSNALSALWSTVSRCGNGALSLSF